MPVSEHKADNKVFINYLTMCTCVSELMWYGVTVNQSDEREDEIMLLGEAVNSYLMARKSEVAPRTIEYYRRALGPLVEWLGSKDFAEVTRDDLRRFRHDYLLEQDWQVSTLHKNLRALRSFFKWAMEEDYRDDNPALALKLPPLPNQPPKAISKGDKHKMIVQAREDIETGLECAVRDYALVLFLADSGCRVGGLVGLTVDDLELHQRRAIVREKGKGGGNNSRPVFFSVITASALAVWLAERKPRQDVSNIFLTRSGWPMDKSTVHRLLRRLGARAGVTGRCNAHSFRHAFAREYLDNHADLGTVSQLLGHSDLDTTHEFYARWTTAELQERHERFSPLAGGAASQFRKSHNADDCQMGSEPEASAPSGMRKAIAEAQSHCKPSATVEERDTKEGSGVRSTAPHASQPISTLSQGQTER